MTVFAYLIEPPFNYRDAAGNVTGCDVELARKVLSMIGIQGFRPVEAEFAELLPGLVSGRWRMTTGLFATDERREIVAFSRPIWALPDGMLVPKSNPLGLTGYRSVAETKACTLAVVRDQLQHRSAIEFGVPEDRIAVFRTYEEAAGAVLDGRADAYVSVARAHTAFIEHRSNPELEVVTISPDEKMPAFGCFGFNLADGAFGDAVNAALSNFLGSPEHRSMMRTFGFADGEIDLVAS